MGGLLFHIIIPSFALLFGFHVHKQIIFLQYKRSSPIVKNDGDSQERMLQNTLILRGLESVRIMSKHSNAPTRRRGKALPRHGRRVKAGCVKHRKPLSIILTASWPRSMSGFCSMRSCESPVCCIILD